MVDKGPQAESWPPRGVWMPAVFFAVAGALDFVLHVPGGFDAAWTALGRGLLNVLLAVGLWHRVWLCRPIAQAYCVAAIGVYSIAIALALTHQPLSFPPSIVVGSAFEVPLSVLVYRHLRSPEAGRLFSNSLF